MGAGRRGDVGRHLVGGGGDPLMAVHYSVLGSLEPADDGWWHARCVCGWEQGPLPDIDTVVDALMSHAADAAFAEGAQFAREVSR